MDRELSLSFLRENNMNAKQFQESVRETFKKHFPNGYINVSKLALGGGVHIGCGMIGHESGWLSRERMNDPLVISLFIHDNYSFNDETTELPKLIMEFAGSYVKVVSTNPHLASESHKIPARKLTQDPVKLIASLDKYFLKCSEVIKELGAENKIAYQSTIPEQYYNF